MSKTKDYFFGDSQEILNNDPDYLDWSEEYNEQDISGNTIEIESPERSNEQVRELSISEL